MSRRKNSSPAEESYGFGEDFVSGATDLGAQEASGDGFMEAPSFATEEKTNHKDYLANIYSIIGGLVGVIIACLIYKLAFHGMRSTNPTVSNIFLVGLLCSCFSVCSYLGIGLYTKTRINRVSVRSECIPIMLLAFFGMFILGGALQYFYSLDYSSVDYVKGADDYVLVVDDSQSMTWNDPDNKRITAMDQLLSGIKSEKRVAFVLFELSIVYQEGLAENGTETQNKINGWLQKAKSAGGTDIQKAVDTALNIPGVKDKDRLTEIILLTDAEDTINANGIIAACNENNIRFSVIALRASNGVNSMQDFISIVQATGGTYCEVDNAEALVEAYATIGGFSNDDRNLIGERKGPSRSNWLLTLFRMLAWAVVGIGYSSFLKIWLRDKLHPAQIPINFASGAFVGIFTEVFGRLTNDTVFLEVDLAIIAIPVMCIVFLSFTTRSWTFLPQPERPLSVNTAGGSGSLNGRPNNGNAMLGQRGSSSNTTSTESTPGKINGEDLF